MARKRKLGDLLAFSLLTYWPLYLMTVSYCLSIIAILFFPEGKKNGLFLLLLGIGLAAYSLAISVISFDKYVLSRGFKIRLLVMYAGWLIMSFPIAFLFLNAIGGVSMAVVESPAGSYLQRLPQYLYATLMTLLAGHFLFVPWIFVAYVLIHKVFKRLNPVSEDEKSSGAP